MQRQPLIERNPEKAEQPCPSMYRAGQSGRVRGFTCGEGELSSRAEPIEGLVGDGVAGQQAGSPARHNGDAEAKGQCNGNDEANSAGHWHGGDNLIGAQKHSSNRTASSESFGRKAVSTLSVLGF